MRIHGDFQKGIGRLRSAMAPRYMLGVLLAASGLLLGQRIINPPEVHAETTDATLHFRSGTITPGNPNAYNRAIGTPRNWRFYVANATLDAVLEYAYDIQLRQIVGGPDWMDKDKFNMAAVPGEPEQPTESQWHMMVRNFLADRFKLSLHHETRRIPVYLLSVATDGPKLIKNESGRVLHPFIETDVPGGVMLHMTNGAVRDFISIMQRTAMDRPIVDQTEMADRYDFSLRWEPGKDQFTGSYHWTPSPSQNRLPDLYTAMQGQLGLTLEPSEADVDVLVIEHVEKPLMEPPIGFAPQPSATLYDRPPAPPAADGGHERITEIVIRGNVVVPTSTLLKSISIHPGDPYDPVRIERDVTALKNTGLLDGVGAQLYDASAGTNAGKLLIFNVHEKPAGGQDRIEAIVIRGNIVIPASTIRKSISIHSGDIYDPTQIERDETALRNTGYFDAVREETSYAPAGMKGGPVVIFYVRERKNAATEPQPAPQNPKSPAPPVDAMAVKGKIDLGNFQMGRGEYDDAIASYVEGLRLDPSNQEIPRKLVGAIGECKNEVAVLNERFSCGGTYPPVPPLPAPGSLPVPNPVGAPSSALDRETRKRITMGDFHMGRGEYDYAIDSYEEGLQLDPSNFEIRQKLGGAIKACSKEVAILNNGLKCGSQYPPVPPLPAPGSRPILSPAAPSPALDRETRKRIMMGDFHMGRGEYDEAIAMYEEGLQLEPSNAEVHRKLDNAIRNCQKEEDLLHEGLSCARTRPVVTPSPAPSSPPLPSPAVTPLPHVNRTIRGRITMGDFHMRRGEYDDAITSYKEGSNLDPSNSILRQKLHGAVKACQKQNSILNEDMNCAAPSPIVILIPSGDFQPWHGPVMKGQMLPDNSIEGGLKPMGGLPVPPMKDAPPNAVVVFIITIGPNGNVTPGRKVSDDHGLAPQVIAAARNWKFEPPTIRGEPVSTNVAVKVTF